MLMNFGQLNLESAVTQATRRYNHRSVDFPPPTFSLATFSLLSVSLQCI